MEQKLPLRRLPVIPGKVAAIILVAAVVIIGVGLYRYRLVTTELVAPYTTVKPSTSTITDAVTGTGPIAASNAVPLNFKSSGKISEIDVNVGDTVKAGQVLAKMDTSDLAIQLSQAQAGLASVQDAYNKLAQGPLATDIAVAQAAVNSASNQLTNARKNLVAAQTQIDANVSSDKTAIQNAQQALADAQRTQGALPAVITQQIAAAKNSLYSAQLTRDSTCSRGGGSCDAANATVNASQSSLDQANAAANQQTVQQQATVNSTQSALNSATAALQNDQAKNQSSLVSAQTQVQTAQDSLSSAQANLAKAAAPSTQPDLDAAQAQIATQQAAVQLAQNNFDAAVLTSPFDGTVTALSGAVGQWLSGGATSGSAASSATGASTTASSSFISITQLTGLQVTSQVNEADVARVQVGQAVTFTVDAFPNRIFTGKVAIIQPLGQTLQNVVSYTVTSAIDPTTVTLLPGMTASESIIINQARNAIGVPLAALTYARGQGASQARTQASSQPSGAGSAFASGAPRGSGGGFASGQPRGQGSAQGAQASGAPTAAGQGSQQAGQGGAAPSPQFEQPGGPGVLYILQAGKLTPIQVAFGISDGRIVQVLSGLTADEQVVTGGGGTGAARSSTASASPKPGGPGGGIPGLGGGIRLGG